MSYLITPPEEPVWRIDQAGFLREMQAHWPQTKVEQIVDTSRSFSCAWTIPMEDRVLEGRLSRDGKSATVDGQIHDCAEFAVWFRTQVPPAALLVFCDDAYNNDIELTTSTTTAAIVNLFTE